MGPADEHPSIIWAAAAQRLAYSPFFSVLVVLGDIHLGVQVDILNRVQQAHPVGQRPLNRLAARDQAHAAGGDRTDAPQIAVGHLVARPIDRVFAGQFAVEP